jgi:hypothetical protein
MLNMSLNNERPTQKLMLKHLCIQDFPGLMTLPEWIEGATETLQTLIIYNLPNLLTLPMCVTTMTRLRKLHIFGCPKLLSLPSDIHHLTTLEYLVIMNVPSCAENESCNVVSTGQ